MTALAFTAMFGPLAKASSAGQMGEGLVVELRAGPSSRWSMIKAQIRIARGNSVDQRQRMRRMHHQGNPRSGGGGPEPVGGATGQEFLLLFRYGR